MTMPADMSASLCVRHLQPRVRFGSSFSHSWLDTSRPMADFALGDQGVQALAITRAAKASRRPLRPQLHRVLEAQVAWVHVGVAGGLRHEQSDHVAGQQVNPQLLLVHLRRLAAQNVHACGGFEVAQVQLDVSAAGVKRREIGLADPSMIEQRGDQHLMPDFDFTQRDLIGGVRVLLGRHPFGTGRRLGPAHDVIARAQ